MFKRMPIINPPRAIGNTEFFKKRLSEARERTVVDLAKFLTGKRKGSVTDRLSKKSDNELISMALSRGYIYEG